MTLVLPPRLTASAEALRDAARRRGLRTVRLPTFDVPAGLAATHLHAGPSFADAVAPRLGIAPLEAPADWLTRLPKEYTRRDIRVMPIQEAYRLRRPAFIKSPNDKGIPALVYTDGSRLPGPDAVDPQTPVLVSDVVEFTTEHRLYLFGGVVHTGSRYAQRGRLDPGPLPADAAAFGAALLAACGDTLPTAIVVDVGEVDGHWAVIEANAAWASGMYHADPQHVLDVVLAAAGPATSVTERNRPFLRHPGGTGGVEPER
ncbi:ATP-grasp domain-containing protein [Streptomyces sp. SP18CS02]|uniref:ATP-grasp domain-containing protein n=1 Tax=Streptomyces sp. SP18CS02 TaxID=3002531 RepID=UPI002E76F600|nr:ATP-grasp domain-containing protein [Streptomyces sp. SP18CS02]MEE1751567.1 ATP-grasp domain-containing protein [Streptomyces sp. SP18CS02]